MGAIEIPFASLGIASAARVLRDGKPCAAKPAIGQSSKSEFEKFRSL
jgi:hypothetical protein